MNDILIKIRQKAGLLKVALEAHQAAATQHHQAWQRWNAEELHTQEASQAIVTTEERFDTTRDEVLSKAQSLLDTALVFIRFTPPRECLMLSQQTAAMQDALNHETVTFMAYSKTSGHGLLSVIPNEAWTAAKDACVQSAFSLMFEASRLPFQPDPPTDEVPRIRESQIDTDLDGSAPPIADLRSEHEIRQAEIHRTCAANRPMSSHTQESSWKS